MSAPVVPPPSCQALRRWARRKDARPDEIMDAALDCFVEAGFAATRLEDVAHRAGVSKGSLYRYFDTKEDLFKAVVRRDLVTAIAAAEARASQFQGSTAQLLREWLHGWWTEVGSTRMGGITKLMLGEAGNFPELGRFYYDEVIARSHDVVHRILRRGEDRGEFRATGAAIMPLLVTAPLVILSTWRYTFQPYSSLPVDPRGVLDAHIDMLLRGLEPTATAAARPVASEPSDIMGAG